VEPSANNDAAEVEAWREAYSVHATSLLRLALLLAGRRDVAEDLVQETFVNVREALAALDAEEVRPYLRAATLNLWRNRLRRLSVEHRLGFSQAPPEELPYEDKDALWRAIRRLPPRQRACVVLRYYEDLTERETAEALACSVGTVKSQTSRALQRLGKELEHADRG
jgi:RNA polymerase sigma-70 factor (sigma-E family)